MRPVCARTVENYGEWFVVTYEYIALITFSQTQIKNILNRALAYFQLNLDKISAFDRG